MEDHNWQHLTQWLRFLLYLELASLVLSMLDYLPINNNWISWLQRILTAGTIYCMFQLAAANGRYRKAAIFRTVQLVCALIGAALSAYMLHLFFSSDTIENNTVANLLSSSVSMIAMAASWVATYQIYNAHGDITEGKDPALAKKWRRLFPISIVVGVLMSVASMILAVVQTTLGVGVNTVTSIVFTIITLPDNLILLVSLLYLWRTVRLMETKEE